MNDLISLLVLVLLVGVTIRLLLATRRRCDFGTRPHTYKMIDPDLMTSTDITDVIDRQTFTRTRLYKYAGNGWFNYLVRVRCCPPYTAYLGDYSSMTMGPRWLMLDSSLCLVTTLVVVKEDCWDSRDRRLINHLCKLVVPDANDVCRESFPPFTVDIVCRHLIMFCKGELSETLLVPLGHIVNRVFSSPRSIAVLNQDVHDDYQTE